MVPTRIRPSLNLPHINPEGTPEPLGRNPRTFKGTEPPKDCLAWLFLVPPAPLAWSCRAALRDSHGIIVVHAKSMANRIKSVWILSDPILYFRILSHTIVHYPTLHYPIVSCIILMSVNQSNNQSINQTIYLPS